MLDFRGRRNSNNIIAVVRTIGEPGLGPLCYRVDGSLVCISRQWRYLQKAGV